MLKKIYTNSSAILLLLGLLGFTGSFASSLDGYLNIKLSLYFMLIIANIFLLISFLKKRKLSLEFIIFLLVIFGSLVLSMKYLLNVVETLFTHDLTSFSSDVYIRRMIKFSAMFGLPTLLFGGFFNISERYKEILLKVEAISIKSKPLFSLSLILLLSNIVVYSPLTVLSSSVESKDPKILITSLYLLGIAFVIYIIFLGIYKLLDKNRRTIFIIVVAFISILSWFYTYILPGYFGNLDGTVLTDTSQLHLSSSKKLMEVGLIFIALCLFNFLWIKKIKAVSAILLILNLMTFGQTVSNIISFKSAANIEVISKSTKIDPSIFRFSEDKNVVILMLDMFSGGYMEDIIKECPDISRGLDGFTWFPNTLTIGNNTFASVPSIMGGYDYTPENMNIRGTDLKDQFNEAYLKYPKVFKPEGYDISMGGLGYIWDKTLFEKEGISYFIDQDLYSVWEKKPENKAELKELMTEREFRNLYIIVGLFKASPFIMKSMIYYGSNWLNFNKGGLTIEHVIEKKAVFEMFSELSYISEGNKTFKYFSNMLTHMPWGMDENGDVLRSYVTSTPQSIADSDNGKYYVNSELVSNTYKQALRLLIEWFNWMKINNVYDNTKIVIVSDHGVSGPSPMFKDFKEIKDANGNIVYPTGRIHSLMLVKEFNSKGPVEISDTFLSNADTFDIVTSNISGVSPINNPVKDRVLSTYLTPWIRKDNENNKYRIDAMFSVTNSIFDIKNWKDMKN